MKRSVGALVAAGTALCVSALGFVLTDDRERSTESAPDPVVTERVDLSREVDRDAVERQAKTQAGHQQAAREELAKAVAQRADDLTHSKRHELRVTIRDRPALADPDAADAYVAKSAGECSAIVWGEESEQLGELLVSPANEGGELGRLETFDLPASARLLRDGFCEATLTISVPYATRYVLTVGIMGRGIAREDAPKPAVVVTKGDSQSVVVLH